MNRIEFEDELKVILEHQLKLIPEPQRDLFVTELTIKLVDTTTLRAIAEYTVSKFCRWYFGDDRDLHPIGGDYFGVWSLNDEFWDFSDIVRALDAKDRGPLTADELNQWYWTNIESKNSINLNTFLMNRRKVEEVTPGQASEVKRNSLNKPDVDVKLEPMSNQASDDIRNHISRSICHEAYSSEYEELTDVAKWTHGELVDEIIMPAISALIRTEKQKLLAEIGEPKLNDAINMRPEQYEGGVIINDWYKNRISKLEAEL